MEKGYAFHVLNNVETVEYLGEAELIIDEAGRVTEVAFVTREFSDFIITSELLEIEKQESISETVPESSIEDADKERVNNSDSEENPKENTKYLSFIIVGILVVIGILVYSLKIKSRHFKQYR